MRGSIDLVFSDNRGHGDVPGTRLNVIDALAVVGESDQPGPAPGSALHEIGEGAIVKAASHADAMTGRIEPDQGHQQEVEVPR